MKTLKLKNSQLDILGKILDGDLPFSRSRKRKLFLDILIQKVTIFESARMALIQKFGKKDNEGKLINIDNQFTIENISEFNKEFFLLLNEEVIIDILPSLEESLKVIKELVNNTDIKVNNHEVILIEEIIKSFDDISK